jgi:hypothetical protein
VQKEISIFLGLGDMSLDNLGDRDNSLRAREMFFNEVLLCTGTI